MSDATQTTPPFDAGFATSIGTTNQPSSTSTTVAVAAPPDAGAIVSPDQTLIDSGVPDPGIIDAGVVVVDAGVVVGVDAGKQKKDGGAGGGGKADAGAKPAKNAGANGAKDAGAGAGAGKGKGKA